MAGAGAAVEVAAVEVAVGAEVEAAGILREAEAEAATGLAGELPEAQPRADPAPVAERILDPGPPGRILG